MAQKQLQPHHQRRALMFLLLAELLSACANAGDDRVGMSLHFINRGINSIGVYRFAPDGLEGPVPGALGPDGNSYERNKQDSQVGKSMSFMPTDSKHGVPQFVDIEWFVSTPEYRAAFSEYKQRLPLRGGMISKEELIQQKIERETIETLGRTYKRRIDLTPILTPELLTQVRANRKNTQLKLKVVFTDDDVTVTASAEVWR
jgi:hypothetical protein